MDKVLDFEYYIINKGLCKPMNPHEMVRGAYHWQSDEWKQFDAFAQDEELPAIDLSNNSKIHKDYIKIIPYDGYPYPYKKAYTLK